MSKFLGNKSKVDYDDPIADLKFSDKEYLKVFPEFKSELKEKRKKFPLSDLKSIRVFYVK